MAADRDSGVSCLTRECALEIASHIVPQQAPVIAESITPGLFPVNQGNLFLLT